MRLLPLVFIVARLPLVAGEPKDIARIDIGQIGLTMVKTGIPLAICTCTSMSSVSTPWKAMVFILATMILLLV